MQSRRRRQGSAPSHRPEKQIPDVSYTNSSLSFSRSGQIQQKRRFVLPLYHAKLLNCDYRIARFAPFGKRKTDFFAFCPQTAPFRWGFRCICTNDRVRSFPSSPEAPLLGELLSDSETERLYEGEPDREPQRNRTSPSRLRRATSPIEGRHWQAGQAHAGRAKFDFIGNSSALLQRAAASGQYPLSSCCGSL